MPGSPSSSWDRPCLCAAVLLSLRQSHPGCLSVCVLVVWVVSFSLLARVQRMGLHERSAFVPDSQMQEKGAGRKRQTCLRERKKTKRVVLNGGNVVLEGQVSNKNAQARSSDLILHFYWLAPFIMVYPPWVPPDGDFRQSPPRPSQVNPPPSASPSFSVHLIQLSDSQTPSCFTLHDPKTHCLLYFAIWVRTGCSRAQMDEPRNPGPAPSFSCGHVEA